MADVPDRNPANQQFGGAPPVGYRSASGRPPKTNLALCIVGAVVLLVAVVAVVVVSASGDDATDADNATAVPTAVATAVVDALNAKDEAAMRPLMCESRVPNVLVHVRERSDTTRFHAALRGSATVTGYSATAQVVLNASGQQRSADLELTLYLAKRGSGWCADQFFGPTDYTGP